MKKSRKNVSHRQGWIVVETQIMDIQALAPVKRLCRASAGARVGGNGLVSGEKGC